MISQCCVIFFKMARNMHEEEQNLTFRMEGGYLYERG